MKIDEELFRALVEETVEENPLACRAALSVERVEITERVETLSVSLGKRSTLRANLAFIRRHCRTEKHVKALLVHEFFHILLGHTVNFGKMTAELNIALDAVINAIIHRKLGAEYSSMMEEYYAQATGILRLLRPMDEAERRQVTISVINKTPVDPVSALHASLYNGTALADDVLSVAQDIRVKKSPRFTDGRPVLLGDHSRPLGSWENCAEKSASRLRQALVALDASGIFHDTQIFRPQALRPPPLIHPVPPSWKKTTSAVLRRLIVPDPTGAIRASDQRTSTLPVLNYSDRRAALRLLWNPLVPEIHWTLPSPSLSSSVQIYLDVSASMGGVLSSLVGLLSGFSSYIRRPLWAFSTEVSPAVIAGGQLRTRTTGGTRMECVYEHLRKTKPRKALVITDGYIEDVRPRNVPPCRIEAIIPHDGCAKVLSEQHRIAVTRLSEMNPSGF